MAKVTIVFGVLLILLSAVAYTMLGQHSHGIHSLIPGAFGLLLVVFGALANTPVAKKRMLFMHIAVTVGLPGFSGYDSGNYWRGADGCGTRRHSAGGGEGAGDHGHVVLDLCAAVRKVVYRCAASEAGVEGRCQLPVLSCQ